MKKIMPLLMVLGLSACNSMGGSVADNSKIAAAIFTQVVDNKCRGELNKQELYQIASRFMSNEQKTSLENKVCGCVAEEAPKHTNFSEIAAAAIDKEAQSRLALKTVRNTIGTCAKKLINF